MLHIVLDANAVGVDPPLAKIEHRVVLDAHRAGQVTLIVPHLALREAVNRWRFEVKKRYDKFLGARQDLVKLVPGHTWRFDPLDRDDATDRLLEDLAAALAAAGVGMPATPEADHEELIQWALARRQPFDEQGSGYRDALHWHIVRELANQGHDVALVSDDRRAFAERREEGAPLAATLAEDVSGDGRVSLYSDLSQAIDDLGLVQPAALEATQAVLDRYKGEFAELLRDRLVLELAHPVHVWVTRELVNPFIASRASLGIAFQALEARVQEARRTDDGRLEASVVLTVRQHVTVSIPEASASRTKGRVSFVDDDGVGVDFEARVEHSCLVVLDPMTDRIVSAEVLEAVRASL